MHADRGPTLLSLTGGLFLITLSISTLMVPVQTVSGAVGMLGAALNQAPADSDLIIVVPNMAELNQDLGSLNFLLGLNLQHLDSVLSVFKRSMGLSDDLKNDGPLLLAVTLKNKAADAPPQVDVLLWVPVGEYGAAIKRLGGDPSATVTKLTLPTGHAVHARKSGAFVIMGPSDASVRAHKAAEAAKTIAAQIGSQGQRCVKENSVSFIFHGENKGELIQLMDRRFRQRLQAASQEAASGTEAEDETPEDRESGPGALEFAKMFAPNLQTVDSIAVRTLRWLKGAEAFVLSFDVDEGGLGLSAAVNFKDGTPQARQLSAGGGAAAQLAHVPDLPYIAAYAVSLDGFDVGASDAKTALLLIGAGWFERIILEASRKGINVKGWTSVPYLPLNLSPTSSLNSTVKVVETQDSGAFVAHLREHLEAINAQSQPSEGAEPRQVRTQYTPNALQLDGESCDQYVITRPKVLSDATAFPEAQRLATETSGYVVALEKFVVVTETKDTTLLRQVLTALRGATDGGLGSEGPIAECRPFVTEDASMEGYIDVASVMNSPLALAAAVFLGPPSQTPVDLLPIAAAVEMQDKAMRMKLFVPGSVLEFAGQIIQSVRIQHGGEDRDRFDRRRMPRRRRRFDPEEEMF